MSLDGIVGRLASQVALLRVLRAGEEFNGTGYALSSPDWILTCHHQVDAADEIEVQFVGKPPVEAFVKASDARMDLAVLEIARHHPGRGVELHEGETVPIGTEVAFLGFPFSDLFDPPMAMIHRGIIGNLYRGWYVVDGMLSEGMSGSPLFLTDSGKVIGTMSSCLDPNRTRGRLRGLTGAELDDLERQRTNISFATPTDRALALLQEDHSA